MLKSKEIEEIVALLWHIPLEKLAEVRALAQSLKDRYGYAQPIDDSDEWTREDELDFTRASVRRLEEEDPWPEEEIEQLLKLNQTREGSPEAKRDA